MSVRLACTAAVLVVLASGCGLKGALEMPAKSSNVVIRGPGSAPPAAGAPATPAGTPTSAPAEERLPPPPPLPGGNPGSAHGG